jgi:hypothetical protein
MRPGRERNNVLFVHMRMPHNVIRRNDSDLSQGTARGLVTSNTSDTFFL